MNCLKTYLFSILLLSYLSVPSSIYAANRDDLYVTGKAAYENDNYVEALKKLYAFYILNEDSINSHPKLKKSLIGIIADCESRLSIAFVSNKGLTIRSNGDFIVEKVEIDRGFKGTGMEIQELIKSKDINIEKMMLRKNTLLD